MSVETYEEIRTRMMYEEQVRKEIRSKRHDERVITLIISAAFCCAIMCMLYLCVR